MALRDLSVCDFLDRLATATPTPGGGSAAALAGALGASLLLMVAGLPKSKAKTDGERAALADAQDGVAPLREELAALVDADAAAFDEVLAAYRLPKDAPGRPDAVDRGLKGATEAPLAIVRAVAGVLHHAPTVARFGVPAAASDVLVGLALLEAAGAGAAENVRANLRGLAETDDFRTRAEAEVASLAVEVAANASAARDAMGA